MSIIAITAYRPLVLIFMSDFPFWMHQTLANAPSNRAMSIRSQPNAVLNNSKLRIYEIRLRKSTISPDSRVFKGNSGHGDHSRDLGYQSQHA